MEDEPEPGVEEVEELEGEGKRERNKFLLSSNFLLTKIGKNTESSWSSVDAEYLQSKQTCPPRCRGHLLRTLTS